MCQDDLEDPVKRLTAHASTERRQALQAERTNLATELARLTNAIAGGAAVDSLISGIRDREARLKAIDAELGSLDLRRTEFDRARLRRELGARLKDWRGLLQRHAMQANQILRRLIVGRLTLTPQEDERGRYYAFRGTGTIQKVLTGLVAAPGLALVQSVASPTGFDTGG
jgi:hypothetical protein